MTEEELFEKFLKEYFENVKRELPNSYRAKQLSAGGILADLVVEYETKFLKQPFLDAIKSVREKEVLNDKRKP